MADGSQWDVENNTQQKTDELNSPTVDADKGEYHLLEQPPTPKESYFQWASEIGKVMAEEAFENKADPFQVEPSTAKFKDYAITGYGTREGLKREFGSMSEACEAFIKHAKSAFDEEINQIGIQKGLDSDELKSFFVFTRRDKADALEYDDGRALLRAYISLLPNGLALQEFVNENLPQVQTRVELYRQFYDEFDPPKEVH